MSIDEIVNVQISRETTAVQRAGFGTALFVDLHKVFEERYRVYTSLNQVVADGFPETSPSYLAARAYFGQELSPTQLLLGRQDSTDTVVLTCTAAAGAGVVYTVKLTVGEDVDTATYTSAGAETAITVAAGIEAAINGLTADFTASDAAANGTLTVAIDTAATDYSIVVSSNISVAATSNESVTAAVTAISALTPLFYAVATYSHLEADILAVAAYIETQKKIYAYSTGNSTDKTTALTGVMGQLSALNYARTFGMWDEESGSTAAASSYFEMGWLGRMLPTAPGAATWAFKTIAGFEALNSEGNPELTVTQSLNLRAANKNGNTYETVGGVEITREGKVAEGEYIDVIIGVDWLDARLTERIYGRLVNLDKIPFTDAGVQIIVAEIRAQLDEAIKAGFLSGETPYIISVPKVANVSANDKANRNLPDITFEATLAGAIHAVVIRGKVVL